MLLVGKAQHGPIAFIVLMRTFDKQLKLFEGPALTWDQAEGNQPFDLLSIPAAKVTPDLQFYYFPNVCGSSDSTPGASQHAVVGNCHRAELSLAW